jgi:hypothetical protein
LQAKRAEAVATDGRCGTNSRYWNDGNRAVN